jgi:hypothetical protein
MRYFKMVKIWKEENVENRTKHSNLVPIWSYFVEVCGFTFRFHSIEHLEEVLEYYRQKLHPSSILSNLDRSPGPLDRSLLQRWYEKLPLYLRKESKRKKVVAALQQAVLRFSEEDQSLSIQRAKPITSNPKSICFESVNQSYWCRTCDTALGHGRCRRCQGRKRAEPERFSPKAKPVAYCNNCGVSLGQGTCRGCNNFKNLQKSLMP